MAQIWLIGGMLALISALGTTRPLAGIGSHVRSSLNLLYRPR